ncbi:ATP-binding protein [Streptomyces fuscigenes]|uniref:ATP-binding protein n=1 Tax=Streptomyces fuscigenes TaxID=1528880 RepID=UPI001F161F30|nr:ATP-binding protein [Streptomyces fuscigenes]MCF3962514.1 ATP-binding protein [Streptomyces fuscigenes]
MTPRTPGLSAALPGGTVGRLLGRASRDAFPYDDQAAALPGRCLARALPADGRAAGEARRFTGRTLREWALGQLVDNAALIVSELLSNALRYGLASPAGGPGAPPAVWLGLLRGRGTVLFAVCDHSASVPEVKEPDDFAQSGRGLHIVECLSETWGWTTPDTDGKAVWAAVACPGARPAAEAVPEPACHRAASSYWVPGSGALRAGRIAGAFGGEL